MVPGESSVLESMCADFIPATGTKGDCTSCLLAV